MKPTAKEKTYTRYSDVVTHHLIPRIRGIGDVGDHATDATTDGNGTFRAWQSSDRRRVVRQYGELDCHGDTSRFAGGEYTADQVKRPKAAEKQVECFMVEEQKKIESAALADRRPKMFGIVLCLYTGLRIGELLALEWSDIDFAKGEISVNKSCHDSKKDGRYCRLTEAPKTPTSRRIVPIPKQLLPLLREQKKKSSSVFVVGEDKVQTVRSCQYSFSLLLRRIGVPHRGFHALRHTFATRALECGMDVKTLSEILGHKNPTVTLNRYVHSLMPHKHEMMNRLGKLL